MTVVQNRMVNGTNDTNVWKLWIFKFWGTSMILFLHFIQKMR